MAVQTFTRPYDYDPSVTKEVVVGEAHTIPAAAPYEVYLRHVPRQQTPSTVSISDGGVTTWTEVSTPPSASGEYRVRYDEALGRIEFHSSDAGKSITVNYNACGTVIWAEDHADGRPNTAEMQEVLERVQEASGIDYASAVSEFTPQNVKAALDALAGVRIVEMGSNANGTYVRWENGLQVCWEVGVLAAYNNSARLGAVWTLPASFVNDTYTILEIPVWRGTDLTSYSNRGRGVYVDEGAKTTTSVQIWLLADSVTSGETLHADVFAIGRWK